jgi:hypothetical protein
LKRKLFSKPPNAFLFNDKILRAILSLSKDLAPPAPAFILPNHKLLLITPTMAGMINQQFNNSPWNDS